MTERCVSLYNGLGANPRSLAMLSNRVNDLLHGSPYSVRHITPEEILAGHLSPDKTALLALGGGFDLGFLKALGTKGMSNIRQYVQQGGSYLGICAGAYFGCERVEFDKGGPLEVCGDRELNFFPGTSIGPSYPNFQYNSESGACAAPLTWDIGNVAPSGEDKHVDVYSYYNGGGAFYDRNRDHSGDTNKSKSEPLSSSDAKDIYSYDVIARYADLPGRPAAVVKCHVGGGVAILSGVHVEYIPKEMDANDPILKDVIPKLTSCETVTGRVLESIMKHLGLQLPITI